MTAPAQGQEPEPSRERLASPEPETSQEPEADASRERAASPQPETSQEPEAAASQEAGAAVQAAAPHIPRVSQGEAPLYKGEPLEAERGPGLGCFWIQVIFLGVLLVLTPLTVIWAWPAEVSAILLIVTLLLLLFAGQTVIFLLRLVAADRRAEGRRRPMRSATPTVGQIEDETTEAATPPEDEPG